MKLDGILKMIREELNLTQELLSSNQNVIFSTLNRWEKSYTSSNQLTRMRL